MIKINLIKEEGKGRAEMKMYLFLYAVSFCFVVGLCFAINSTYSARLAELEERRDQLASEKSTLEAKTKGIKKLEEEKQMLREKLLIIARLKKSKTGPVQVLDRINLSLPDRAWLKELSENADSSMKIIGYALNNEAVSVFADELSQSEFFPAVKIEEVSQDTYKDIKISKFTLGTKIRYEGAPAESLKKKES